MLRTLLLVCLPLLLGATWHVDVDPELPPAPIWEALRAWEEVADVHFVPAEPGQRTVLRIRRGFPPPGLLGQWQALRNLVLIHPRVCSRDELRRVVQHEAGHVLGLEHCPEEDCLMFRTVGGRRVCDYERQRLRDLYGPPRYWVRAKLPSTSGPWPSTLATAGVPLPEEPSRTH